MVTYCVQGHGKTGERERERTKMFNTFIASHSPHEISLNAQHTPLIREGWGMVVVVKLIFLGIPVIYVWIRGC